MLIPLSLRRISSLAPSYSTARQVLKNLSPGVAAVDRAPPSLRQPIPGAFSSRLTLTFTLIVAPQL